MGYFATTNKILNTYLMHHPRSKLSNWKQQALEQNVCCFEIEMEVLFQLNPKLRRCNSVSVYITYLSLPGFIFSPKPHSVNEGKTFFRVFLNL